MGSTPTPAATPDPAVTTCGAGQFCLSGSTFSPKGFNYATGHRFYWPAAAQQNRLEITNVTDGFIDLSRINSDLQKLSTDGFNVIRYMVSSLDEIKQGTTSYYQVAGPSAVSPSTHELGLYKTYMNNLIQFVDAAKNHGIRVILELDYLPNN